MAGLFFCLASAEGAGLLLYSDSIQPNTSVYSVLCSVHEVILTTPQNSIQSFTAVFPAIAPAQPPTIPDRQKRLQYRLRHAGKHIRARTRSTYTRYHRHAGTLYRSAQAAYYNNVYKRVQGRPCYGSMPDGAAYRRPCQPGGLAPTVCGSLASADTLSAVQTRRTC